MKQFISLMSSTILSKSSNRARIRTINMLLLSLLVLASSCRKNQDASAPTPMENSEMATGTAPLTPAWDPSNKYNPYDKVGVLHNLLLDSAIAYIELTGDTTRSGIHERIAQVFHGAIGIDPRFTLSKIEPAVDYEIAIYGERAIDSYKLPADVKGYLDRLWGEINATADADYPALKGRIMMLEEEILQDKRLGEESRWLLLSTTSVARYSTAHWISWATGNTRLVLTMGLVGAVKAAIKTGLADAAAMVIGWMLHLPYDVITDMSAAVSSIVYHNLMDR